MNKSNYYFSADRFYMNEDTSWFISLEDNYLMKRDNKTGVCEVIDSVSDSNEYSWCSECVKIGDFVYCLPNRAKSLYIYSLLEHSWINQILLEENDCRLTCELVKEQEDCFWFISRGNSKLYKYSITENKIYTKDLRTDISKINNVEYQYLSNVCIENDELYFGLINTNVIVKYNCKNDKIMTFNIPISDSIWRVQKKEDNLYLIGLKKALYEWNINSNTVHIKDNFPDDFGGVIINKKTNEKIIDFKSNEFILPLFNYPICRGNEVWLIPFIGNEILIYNSETSSFTTYSYTSNNRKDRVTNKKYNLIYYLNNRYLGIYSHEERVYFEIDLEDKTDKILDMIITSEGLEKMGMSMIEEGKISMELFLELVTNN